MIQNSSTTPIARLGNNHGYAIDGDTAHLNADILFDESRLAGQQWTLQLWADDQVKVAELALGLLPINGSGFFRADGLTAAFPPAGQDAHRVALVLTNDQDDSRDRITYSQTLSVSQPRIRGTVCCSFAEQQLTLALDRIENPRSGDNQSGTLALELWAMDTPYAGGAWSGTPVASLVLGTLTGQSQWQDCQFTTHAAPLPGTGQLTLMLREWTPAGYVTRDFRAITLPGQGSSAAEEPKAQAPAATSATPAAAKAEATATATATATTTATEAKATPTKSKTVAVNSASVEQIAAIKGVSQSVAKAIVAGRPYKTLEALLKIKGVGAKLFDKIRAQLSL